MSGLSPIDRFRAAHDARQRSRTLDVDLWDDGQLVARVGVVDAIGARDAMRTLMRLAGDQAGNLTEDDLAGVIAAATRGLYARGDDGELEQMVTAAGAPLLFDPGFGAGIGKPEITTAIGAVVHVFTEGDPPVVNGARMLTVAMRIAGWVVSGDDGAEDAASGS